VTPGESVRALASLVDLMLGKTLALQDVMRLRNRA